MQAMNGSAVPRGRRGRLIGCIIAVLALSAILSPSIASAKAPPPPVNSTLLAMGDSLAFGYSQQLYNECESKGDPAICFENGYANDYWRLIKGSAKGLKITNDGCPGETTESMIGNSPALLGLLNFALKASREKEEAETGHPSPEVTGESPCAYGYAWQAFKTNGKGGPLHNEYGAGQSNFEVSKTVVLPGVASQLENTLKEINADEALTPVTTITLNIGANDELHTLGGCEAKAKAEVEANAAKGDYNKQVGEEIAKGEFTAEEGAGTEPADKERGERDAKEDGERKAKSCITAAFPGLLAQISKNTQGVLVALRHGGELGLLAKNYTGKILYSGGYNPFGEVIAGQGELKPGTNELAGIENIVQHKTVEAFLGCFTDPQLTFNPRNPKEPIRLDKWTNMTNTSEFEGKKNGPDIHPTPLGYKEIAMILKKESLKEEKKGKCL